MFYFDKYGNPTEKPAMKKPAPAGVTVKTVLDNYINAIGGQKAVAAVKTVSMVGTATIPQAPAPLKFTMKKDAKGKSLVKLKWKEWANYQNKWLMKKEVLQFNKV
jgi:hypothetical protein